MKKKVSLLKWTGVICLVGVTVVYNSATVYAYINRTGSPSGTAGSVLPTDEISGGTDFFIKTTNEPNLGRYVSYTNIFRYGADGIPIYNGNDTSGGIWEFDHTSENGIKLTANNGYKMVGIDTIGQWISALKGDSSYVNARLWNTTFTDMAGQTFNVSDVAQIVNQSGASFVPLQPGQSKYDQAVYATDPPSAAIGIVGSSNVSQGTPLEFYDHASIEAYHSTYHFEYVSVTGPNGQSVPVGPLQGAAPYNGETLYAPNGAVMTEINGGGTTSYPPSPVNWVNGGSSTPNKIDTTNLSPGRYTITLYVKDWFNRAASATTASFTVTSGKSTVGATGANNGNGSGAASGNGGANAKCPPPTVPPQPANSVLSYNWSPDGSGGQLLTWQDTNWVLQTVTSGGCPTYQWQDQPKTYTHDYPLYLSNMQVTGLFYDPGKPGDLWSPTNTSASQSNNDQYSDGSTSAGNQALPTYGNPNASPVIYARVGGGFSFRLMWTGAPNDMPASANVSYSLINPDGETRTWNKAFQLLSETVFNEGDVPVWDANGNGYPPPATEYGWAYTSIPKYASPTTPTGYNELAQWNLTGDPSGAAHISSSVTFTTGMGSTVTWSHSDLAQMLNYPTWYFIHETPVPNAKYEQTQPTYNYSYNAP